ncbi:ribonuclease P protein component [Sutcliffiella rhizosphaerae]|uniref:Ribonuclease P protein component n=1 Tax=Sutcliffiella rhizosphaerae TaxID=2880967 RepID=A0ABM8YSA9_9BACI|nr:ribonuclease P protein component [Sutcliffiella rhizosphaerae]CAG9622879.1 Ribonuclease P protein component [Sutcliffiella rhizosphaerae]
MRKQQRIKKNKDFQHVFQKGKSMANRQFVIYAVKQEGQSEFRVGLSVSKKIGNAVTRNRIKRLIREAIHELKDRLPVGIDLVVIARKPTAEMSLEEVKSSLQHVIKKLPGLSKP